MMGARNPKPRSTGPEGSIPSGLMAPTSPEGILPFGLKVLMGEGVRI